MLDFFPLSWFRFLRIVAVFIVPLPLSHSRPFSQSSSDYLWLNYLSRIFHLFNFYSIAVLKLILTDLSRILTELLVVTVILIYLSVLTLIDFLNKSGFTSYTFGCEKKVYPPYNQSNGIHRQSMLPNSFLRYWCILVISFDRPLRRKNTRPQPATGHRNS